MAGFTFRHRRSGGAPTIQTIVTQDTGTLTKGDLVNLESGEADLAVTNDTALIGVVLETKATVDSVTKIKVITDGDAVYGVKDNNARKIGANLDITGGTGAQGVGSSTNADLLVMADSSATEESLVMITPAEHWAKGN